MEEQEITTPTAVEPAGAQETPPLSGEIAKSRPVRTSAHRTRASRHTIGIQAARSGRRCVTAGPGRRHWAAGRHRRTSPRSAAADRLCAGIRWTEGRLAAISALCSWVRSEHQVCDGTDCLLPRRWRSVVPLRWSIWQSVSSPRWALTGRYPVNCKGCGRAGAGVGECGCLCRPVLAPLVRRDLAPAATSGHPCAGVRRAAVRRVLAPPLDG